MRLGFKFQLLTTTGSFKLIVPLNAFVAIHHTETNIIGLMYSSKSCCSRALPQKKMTNLISVQSKFSQYLVLFHLNSSLQMKQLMHLVYALMYDDLYRCIIW